MRDTGGRGGKQEASVSAGCADNDPICGAVAERTLFELLRRAAEPPDETLADVNRSAAEPAMPTEILSESVLTGFDAKCYKARQ